jgi:protein TonB
MRKLSYFALTGALVASAATAFNDAQPAAPARPKHNLANLLSDEDYPAAARAAGEEGMVEFTLDVAANGRVAACAVTRSSGSAALDSATCRLLKARARFTPASDAAGAPVSATVAGRIGWRLPQAPPAEG